MQGGQLATILKENAHRGERFVQEYAARLLRRVCVPLHTMIRHWIYRGELNDPHGDFFIAPRVSASATPLAALAAAHAWTGSYELRTALLPSFIGRPLATKILRAGKTINFLREVCGDTAWVQESAAAAQFAPLEADQVRTLIDCTLPTSCVLLECCDSVQPGRASQAVRARVENLAALSGALPSRCCACRTHPRRRCKR